LSQLCSDEHWRCVNSIQPIDNFLLIEPDGSGHVQRSAAQHPLSMSSPLSTQLRRKQFFFSWICTTLLIGAIHVPPLPKAATIASSSLVPQVENSTVGGTFVAQVIVRRGGLCLPT
jgi:hypothetical protein